MEKVDQDNLRYLHVMLPRTLGVDSVDPHTALKNKMKNLKSVLMLIESQRTEHGTFINTDHITFC